MTQYGQIMMTYRCSAACKHCLVMSSPGQDATRVTLEDAVEYGRDFQSLGRGVIIAGGEALLFFNHVLTMCRALQEAGVPVAFIESNGSWCRTDRLTIDRLRMLRQAGVQGMYFSIDGYHQEFVPAERVHRGARIAREIFGPEQVIASNLSLEDARSLETLTADPERLRQFTRTLYLHWIGRAALELAGFRDLVPLEELTQQDCRAALDIDHLKEIQVDPFGFVRPDICPGVNLGNTRQQRVAELCRTQQVRETPLLQDLSEQGPAALLPLARRFGITVRSHYVDKCHLCFDLRRQLVSYLPEEFGPKHVYEVTL
jgi:organic radical activating enzyme